MPLDLYNKKRNFKNTPEPKGKVSRKYKNLFIIQKHDATHLHYDFRLELNGVLLSWAIPKGPCLDPTVKRLAIQVEDHPVEYGYFEGIIPKEEYGGGTVMLWDKGTWLSLDEDPAAAYHKGHLKFILKAKKLKGEWNLIRFKKDPEKKSWFLIKSKDKYAKPILNYDITLIKPNSVLTHFNLKEIEKKYAYTWTNKDGLKKPSTIKKSISTKQQKKTIKIDLPESRMPSIIYPQLATMVNEAPVGNDWIHELKFDGYRILAFKENNNIRLMSRNNREWTEHFTKISKAIKKLTSKKILLDGEVVLLDKNNKTNFQLLQNSIGKNKPFIYYIFDLLYYDKYNLMPLPLNERKSILKKLLTNFESNTLRYSDHIVGSGPDVFNKACEMGLEGIVSKNIHINYVEKRTKSWLKLKCVKRQEFVIGGFSPPKGSRSFFGSLYLGYYERGKLKFCGNVGTGFNQASLKNIYGLLSKNITKANPFSTKPPGITTAIWVKPKLVAEVEFSEWTTDGMLRHPSFKGLRKDKLAKNITREQETTLNKIKSVNQSKGINKKAQLPFKLTNPDKLLYPESNITKYNLAHYYYSIQEWILPYIVNRPLTLVRCPENYKDCFYQKHINKSTPDTLFGIKIKEKDKFGKCIYIKNIEGLMALVQMGTLEIHPWGSKIESIEYPDIITIDLDPAPDIKWKQVVITANRIKTHLLDFKLRSFVKTTGGKGLHVVIPIKPEYDWEQVKIFSRIFVKLIVSNYPNEYVSEMSKAKRKGKIFIDYLRNQRGATAVAAYSTRARPHAPVSVPLDWDELTTRIKDTSFTIFTLPQRLANLQKDPWKDFFKIKQSLGLDKI